MAYVPIIGASSSSSAFGDTTFTKVFVGGLAWETQSDTLRRHFEHFGHILEAVVIYDKNTGRSMGYGFVTFRDPESARRACADPDPVIDGRRANCNLAAFGRPPLSPHFPYGHLRPSAPMHGGLQATGGPYIGSFGYHTPPYGYPSYGAEYAYPQGVYNPYVGQQYIQMYGVPGTSNAALYPYGHLSQTISGGHGYAAVRGHALPSHQIVQYANRSISPMTNSPMSSIQPPYPTGIVTPVPVQRQYMVPAPRFMQGTNSSQTTG